MNVNLKPLENQSKLLFEIELKPVQGHRFQPTGFPSLGAATYQTKNGEYLQVESPQSMANRMEAVCWNTVKHDVTPEVEGISYVKVNNKSGAFLTASILEAHRLNSVYIEKADKGEFHNRFGKAFDYSDVKQIDRTKFIATVFKYDLNSLLHGLFLESMDGRLRIQRAISCFIEAEGVRPAVSGGVKVDHVKPTKSEGQGAAEGHGNVIFTREEFTADRIVMYVNFDLAQIRGYGLAENARNLLILLALYKLRAMLDCELSLRTACKFELVTNKVISKCPADFDLPTLEMLKSDLRAAIDACKGEMLVTPVVYDESKVKNGKKDSTTDSVTDENGETKEP